MSTDILERLETMRFTRLSPADENEILKLAKDEIVRLRGEVAAPKYDLAMVTDMIGQLIDISNGETPAYPYHLSTLNEQFDLLRQSVEPPIAPAEAKDPAPAMPDGVEADMSAQLDATTAAYERMTAYTIVHKGQLVYMSDLGRAAYSDVVAERDAALRAADNRDAAGVICRVCDGGPGNAGSCLCGERKWDTPAAVPAGEAVAARDGWAVIEAALARAVKADPADAPFGTTPAEASVWHAAQASAYQHALEMIERTPQPADGEAVAPFGWVRPSELDKAIRLGDPGARIGVHVSPVRDEECTAPLYTTPPAPVQAAPQEGGVYQPVRFGGIRRPSDEALAAAFWEHRQRENSLPADLCDSKLVKFGNDIVQRARELAPYLAANPSACELVDRLIKYKTSEGTPLGDFFFANASASFLRPYMEAALQHRGDSQEMGHG